MQRTEEAEISGNTAASSPKEPAVSVPDSVDNESEPKVVESKSVSS